MSWENTFNSEEREESFWPSFTDIMMVIVMTFLLVTVAVVMTNTRLLDELKHSLVAEREANQRAEFTLQENTTLEEQLEYFQQRSSALEMELLRSRAQTEQTRGELLETQAALARLQDVERTQALTLEQQRSELVSVRDDYLAQRGEVSRLQVELGAVRDELNTQTERLQTELALAQRQLTSSQAAAQESAAALTALREATEADRQKLASLEGDYAELDKKYQKLLKPTRSSKGKTVVDVMYRQSGYRLRKPGSENYYNVSRNQLEDELRALKVQYGTDLYVKIIIPENSGLSYNQAWKFTSEMLNKYDYYYQEAAVE